MAAGLKAALKARFHAGVYLVKQALWSRVLRLSNPKRLTEKN
ncbi:hypothetical protein SAMN05720766_12612 [Fibrobacter sp. UWH9]|nr:hypothetical protein [Fibrobacter sp. UWH9]SHH80741.1 hypothetical protein SAMN05720766_12612 [Fibrobacter sp. UWH9]